MSTEEYKRLAKEAIGIWTAGDLDAADEFYAPDYVNHQHHDPADPRDLRGVEAMKSFVTEFRSAFPDFHDSIDIQVAEGELVVTRFTSMGTHRGTFMGVEPTNRELVWTGITIDRVSGGQDSGELGQLGYDGYDAATRRHPIIRRDLRRSKSYLNVWATPRQ